MSVEDRIDKQFEFIREIDKVKEIVRQTYVVSGKRKENDAEHSWHMAIMVLILNEYSNEDLDILKTINMLLIHDLVEIYAGDTYAYDEEAKKNQKDREVESAKKLFAILPDDQAKYFWDLWLEFEQEKTVEAKFARTMDNIQPLILNDATNGKSWREHLVRLNQILQRNKNTCKGSKRLWDYSLEKFILPNVDNGSIIEE